MRPNFCPDYIRGGNLIGKLAITGPSGAKAMCALATLNPMMKVPWSVNTVGSKQTAALVVEGVLDPIQHGPQAVLVRWIINLSEIFFKFCNHAFTPKRLINRPYCTMVFGDYCRIIVNFGLYIFNT